MPITIIDYGASNLKSMANALEKIGVLYTISSDASEIKKADKIILPGVGSAQSAMLELKERGLVQVIKNLKKPFLGICLGMQILFEYSKEGETECLGIIKGQVKKFDSSKVKVPQMGWNRVMKHETRNMEQSILSGLSDEKYFYFVHSYYCVPDDKQTVRAVCDYGGEFAAVINQNNFYGVQFHPEKSGEAGLRVLEKFANNK